MVSGDTAYSSYNSQVHLVKENGFQGIEIGSEESFAGMLDAIQKNGFKASSYYVRLNVEDEHVNASLASAIKILKGSGAVISPHIEQRTGKTVSPHEASDKALIKLLRELSSLCESSGLQVAIYPHLNFYVETTDHALELARKVNRKNLGLGFNLCHWLATTSEQERRDLNSHLKTLRPYLKMMTICGANNVISQKQNIWDDYILPLGQGSFDVEGLVTYVTGELAYRGPIGIQAFNIRGDRKALVHSTAEAVKLLQQKH